VTFNTFFRISSYISVTCGVLALTVSGGVGLGLAFAFTLTLFVSWKLEGTRWQLSERIGLAVVLLSLPIFYLDWNYQLSIGDAQGRVGMTALAHLILFLSIVKLLQYKLDRDWVFLYLISFFEFLLSAGLSVSPLFLLVLGLYMLFAICTIISFEIRRAKRSVKGVETRLLVAPDSPLIRRLSKRGRRWKLGEARRLPVVSLTLLIVIFALATPLFFIVPRSRASVLTRSNGGLVGFTGFSDTVRLGEIGRLQESNRVVMRVRVKDDGQQGTRLNNLQWRGVALDEYTGQGWHKSTATNRYVQANNERNFFQVGLTDGSRQLIEQTFFVEPINTPVLFAAGRAIAVQGTLPFVRRDEEDSLITRPHDSERISYKVFSELAESEPENFREDILRGSVQAVPVNSARYLQLPESLDGRIAQLAQEVIAGAGATNRYDAARAVESYLQSERNFRYTLDMKASGADPLADFLFNVRAGHCEYFATAMAVMLRTQGIPTRIVNGFRTGDYNEASGAYTVTEKEAHSWVEVYFSQRNQWVTFDPTPLSGRPTSEETGLTASIGKYADAFSLLWFQYVVGYNKQEQRTLATSVRNQLFDYRRALSEAFEKLKQTASGLFKGPQDSGAGIGSTLSRAQGYLLVLLVVSVLMFLVWLARRVRRMGFWRGLFRWRKVAEEDTVIEFYRQMINLLAARGLKRAIDETPLEFAGATAMPEVLRITRAYNRVRFGGQGLSENEAAEINAWLVEMRAKGKA
jgi:transglutaminase-like putative cysteine protease